MGPGARRSQVALDSGAPLAEPDGAACCSLPATCILCYKQLRKRTIRRNARVSDHMNSNRRVSCELPALPRERAAIAEPLFERITRAVADILAKAPLEVLQRAAAAPTGAGSVAELISSLPGASPRLAAADPEAAAIARAAVMKQEILESTPTFSTAEVAQVLGMTAEGVRKRRLAGRILALHVGSDFRYPVWQFSEPATGGSAGSGMLPGLEEILAAIPSENPWVRFDLLTTRIHGARNKTVLDLLRLGNTEAAIKAAASYGKHGA